MNSGALNELVEQIELEWPRERWVDYGVVVAVSGGADSIALLRALSLISKRARETEANGFLSIAHFHHGLRGDDADGDADFVRGLAELLELPFYDGCASKPVGPPSEDALRNQRYDFLIDVARKTNSRYITTAHHRDDQVETLLFRLFRGTGLPGLCGIPRSRVVDESISIVRPMLSVSRQTIEKALNDLDQPWREDGSNAESAYSRNFIRNEILPSLRTRFDHVDEAVARLTKQAAQQQAFLTQSAEPLLKWVIESTSELVFDCQQLANYSPVVIRELLMLVLRRSDWPTSELGFDDLDQLARCIIDKTQLKRRQIPGGINCQSDGKQLRLWK